MSSRVTAVRSSQPRIGVGTSDNMVDLLLRTPHTSQRSRRKQRGGKIAGVLLKSIGKQLPKAALRSGKVAFKRGVKRGVQRGKVVLKRRAKEAFQRGKVALKRKAKEGLQQGLKRGLAAIGDTLNDKIEDMFSE